LRKNFFTFDNLEGEYPAIKAEIARATPTAVFGLSDPHKYLIASLCEQKIVYLCADGQTAKKAAESIRTLSGKTVALLAAKDEVLLPKAALSRESLFRRLNAVYEFKHGAEVLVADAESVIQLFPRDIPAVHLEQGKDTDLTALLEKLVAMGYTREQAVENKGSFALHGDILDVYPVNIENPARVDFFGDEVESIKPYDFVTGDRLPTLPALDIIAATDAVVGEEDKKEIPKILQAELKKCKTSEAYARSLSIADDMTVKTENGEGDAFLLPLLENTCDFFTLLKDDTLLVFDDGKAIYDRLDGLYKEHEERFARLSEAGEVFSFTKNQYVDRTDFFSNVTSFRCLALQTFATKVHFFEPFKIFNLKSTPVARYLNSVETLFTDIGNWLLNKYRIILFCGTSERAERLKERLYDESKRVSPDVAALEYMEGVEVRSETLDKGIVLHESKLVLVGTGDMFTGGNTQKRIKRRRGDMFLSPEVGDYAVHETHGIGKIVGMRKLETLEGIKEYIALEYKGGDMLYLPVERMDTLSKYVGEDNPTLSKIGGGEFERVKERVRNSLKKMAFDLKKLYAERAEKRGYEFPYYEDMMEEFYAAFDHTETPDQLSSVKEIISDMCSKKVMDRLLCGDVGFGKTEVAFRAVYLCVLGGKQAALMCPGTILSDQHYNTALKRFKDFGVRVECINRFRTPKEQEKILADLREGKIDFIIGTHRLLSKDVKFADLGLLILDEEQRFGVEHKEKIKNLKHDVDCLTMSATPIPRTLHMSLSGIRDISTIQTPPAERLPVQTYVVEETEALIRDACIRELSRGGQVFILYNRVESISTFAKRIMDILPEGKVCVTHGQMEKSVLENNVMKFYAGECNILITTTIIENGIDLPNANTIIVIDADRLGVSQLYQLRGRVGRSNRLAHAYFTYKAEKVLTEDARSRLTAIMEFTELGSGYKIAMRDLEIRGAGNVLGAEQHGHMDRVGYELYSKLLKEELTGEVQTEAELDIKATAYIPESYIESSAGRLDCYKRIAEIRSIEDYKRVLASIEENYGEMPPSMLNLLIIAVLKNYASKFNVAKITVAPNKGGLQLSSIKTLANDGIRAALDKYKGTVSISMTNAPVLVFQGIKKQTSIMLEMTKFLKYAATFTLTT
jgi:transcription-repair coupling factor (superfamily II helicase)